MNMHLLGIDSKQFRFYNPGILSQMALARPLSIPLLFQVERLLRLLHLLHALLKLWSCLLDIGEQVLVGEASFLCNAANCC